MNKFLIGLATALALPAFAQVATPPVAPASAAVVAADDSCGERVTMVVVNGKPVQVRKKIPCAKPQAVRLWD